jgi:hypothetical protein
MNDTILPATTVRQTAKNLASEGILGGFIGGNDSARLAGPFKPRNKPAGPKSTRLIFNYPSLYRFFLNLYCTPTEIAKFTSVWVILVP